jgi:hypothetical protein
MKNNIYYPMTLNRLLEELTEAGVEVMVNRSTVEYDEHIIGRDVYLTLECRVIDRRPDDSEDAAYDRAMKALGL